MRIRKPKGEVKTTCSKCTKPLEENRIGKKRYCKSCQAESMKLNRPKHSELDPLQKLKANARSYLNVYIRRGKIIKQPCISCGDLNTEGHHHDYTKPLDVVWYCRKCHLNHHSGDSPIL
jgi:hypothetical protein